MKRRSVLAAALAGVLVGAPACGHRTPSTTAPPDADAIADAPRSSAVDAAGAPDTGTARAATPKIQRIVLHARRAMEPRAGAVIEPAWIVVEGQTITYVATTAPPDATDATDAIDLEDATILPGLIDAHSHLLHAETPDETSMVTEATTMSDGDRALRGALYARQMLNAGFTTVRDLGNAGRTADVSLRDAIAHGWVEGPTMFVSTRALAPTGGQFPRVNERADVVEQEYAVVTSAAGARTAAARAIDHGADCIKIIVESGPKRTLTLDEVRAATEAAHARGKKVAAHVTTEEAADLAVAAGVDSLEHAYAITDRALGEMAKRKITLVPTDYPLAYYERFAPEGPKRQAMLDRLDKFHAGSMDRLRRAHTLHVPIAAGSDAYVVVGDHDRGKDAARIFRAYEEAGLTPMEIVQAATVNGARLLGLPDDAGSLAVGAPADVLVVRGDLAKGSQALERPLLVVKSGHIVYRAE